MMAAVTSTTIASGNPPIKGSRSIGKNKASGYKLNKVIKVIL